MAEHRAQYLKDTPPTRVICTALLLAMTSCITPKPLVITARPVVEASQPHPGDAPHAAIRWYNTFWKALADMNVQAAWIVADGSEQRKLADAIEDFLAGNNAAADSTVVPLLSARDSVVRNAARITYGAILTAEGNWTRLAVYADSAKTASRDAAGVETWASAFKGVSTSISFGDSVSVVPLGRSRSGVPIVPVIVNGVKRYFWLDTGSSITILTSDVANASHITGISGDTLELVTSVGRLPTQAAVIASLKVGRVTVTNARAMIVSSGALQMREVASDLMPQTIDGVIGFDVIRSLDLTIDDVNGRVVIRTPALCAPGKGEDEGRNLSWYGVPIVTLISETGDWTRAPRRPSVRQGWRPRPTPDGAPPNAERYWGSGAARANRGSRSPPCACTWATFRSLSSGSSSTRLSTRPFSPWTAPSAPTQAAAGWSGST